MRIVIDKTEFRLLSPSTQKELIETFTGNDKTGKSSRRGAAKLRWRRPIDLTPEQAIKLVHGLPEDYRRRLELFTRKGGRIRMKDIMEATGDRDLRPSSEFQKAMTRRLRRMIDDPDKKAQLIGWDFDSTKWDDGQTTIVDGVYYVTETTSSALKSCLVPAGGKRGGKEKT
jgi:hypothetical protein